MNIYMYSVFYVFIFLDEILVRGFIGYLEEGGFFLYNYKIFFLVYFSFYIYNVKGYIFYKVYLYIFIC